jgi:hypothetical protein
LFLAAVSTGKDGDLATLFGKTFGKDLDYRGFSGSAAGQIADAYHLTAYRMITEKSFIVEPEAELHRSPIESGGNEQKPQNHPVSATLAASFDKFQEIAFPMFPKVFDFFQQKPLFFLYMFILYVIYMHIAFNSNGKSKNRMLVSL